MTEGNELPQKTGEGSQKSDIPRWTKVGPKTYAVFEKILTDAGHTGFRVAEMAIKYPPLEGKSNPLSLGHSDILGAFISDEYHKDRRAVGVVASSRVGFPESHNSYIFLAYKGVEPSSVIGVVTRAAVRANEAISQVKGIIIPLPPKS